MNKKNNKGFSLVELIVVIAIMAVLVGVLAPSLLRYVEKSRLQKDISAISEVQEAAKIALADETIYNNTGDTSTITVNNAGSLGGTATDLATEVKKVVGDFKFTSNGLKAATVTFKVTKDATNSTVDVKISNVTGAGADAQAQLTTEFGSFTTTAE